MKRRPRILLTGTMAARPYAGGNTWAFLQWVLGFQRLGLETFFVEEIRREDIVDDTGQATRLATSVNARYFGEVAAAFDLGGRVALLERGGPGHVGLSRTEVEALAPSVDGFLNQYGRATWLLPLIKGCRVYWDTDPGYTQVWQEAYDVDMGLRDHDMYLTVGLGVGRPGCPLPTAGVSWETTLWPVVVSEWSTSRPAGDTYTTIADWRGFGAVEWRGVWYGQKADEFRRIVDLPRRVRVPLELCLAIHPEDPDRVELDRHGWRVIPARRRAGTPAAYRDYVLSSRGEFTCVKGICAAGQIGWIGDRTACYLAGGRPAIVQSTGIERYLPTGDGLLTFSSLEGAVAAIDRVESRYAQHAEAARVLAREHLDSDKVLGRLGRLIGVSRRP